MEKENEGNTTNLTGNVLVIGNSGVGKSTLINAVLGAEVAATGWGSRGTTRELEIYDSPNIPFRIIDSIGFEPSFFKERKAINAAKKWSKDCAKKGQEDNQINVIWFCVEGTKSKLFEKDMQCLSRATAMWKSIPVIVVITKSYSKPDRIKNKEMIQSVFKEQKKYTTVPPIIPVVAQEFLIDENTFVAPDGISELIDKTNELMPDGLKYAKHDLDSFILNRKRALAHAVVTTATASAVAIAAVPLPFSDAFLITPIEIAEINAIASIYEIGKTEKSKRFLNSIVDVGAVSLAAKTLISALKLVPGINIAVGVLNALVAGVIVSVLGEGAIYAFEQVYLGYKTIDDIDWVHNLIESKLSDTIIEKIKPILEKLKDNPSKEEILCVVQELVSAIFNNKKGFTE